jgi:predicted Zn finger-like uncharacterized protein
MAIQIGCPRCRESYRLPDTQLGKRVRCRGCGETFLVQQEEDDVPVLEEASPEDLRRFADRRRPSRRPEVEELPVLGDSGVRSRSAPPRRYEDDRDFDDEYEDGYDEPPRGGSALVIVGIIGVILLLLGAGGGLAWYFASRSPRAVSPQASTTQPGEPAGGKTEPGGAAGNPGGNPPVVPRNEEVQPKAPPWPCSREAIAPPGRRCSS